MPKSTLQQMIGRFLMFYAYSEINRRFSRAGRPGFDTSGVAVVMTCESHLQYYQDLSLEVIESTLPSIFVEGCFYLVTSAISTIHIPVMCAEISQLTIRNIHEAMHWLMNTYFYIRLVRAIFMQYL